MDDVELGANIDSQECYLYRRTTRSARGITAPKKIPRKTTTAHHAAVPTSLPALLSFVVGVGVEVEAALRPAAHACTLSPSPAMTISQSPSPAVLKLTRRREVPSKADSRLATMVYCLYASTGEGTAVVWNTYRVRIGCFQSGLRTCGILSRLSSLSSSASSCTGRNRVSWPRRVAFDAERTVTLR